MRRLRRQRAALGACTHSLVQNVQTTLKRLPVNSQRRKKFDHLVLRAASFYHKSVFEGLADNFLGQFARTAVKPHHHAPSTYGKVRISVALSDLPKALAQDASCFDNSLDRFSFVQYFRKAAVPVTSARLLPLKVPLCSPGRHTSSRV